VTWPPLDSAITPGAVSLGKAVGTGSSSEVHEAFVNMIGEEECVKDASFARSKKSEIVIGADSTGEIEGFKSREFATCTKATTPRPSERTVSSRKPEVEKHSALENTQSEEESRTGEAETRLANAEQQQSSVGEADGANHACQFPLDRKFDESSDAGEDLEQRNEISTRSSSDRWLPEFLR
jgi:hypothetical protein